MTGGRRQLIMAAKRGFCGGVRTAMARLEGFLAADPAEPVYVLHELVHNRHLTDSFRRRGVRFVNTLAEVPAGARLILGAHGVSAETERAAKRVTARLSNATCPLVRARQRAAAGLDAGDSLILLGHPGHSEVAGILGWSGAGENIVVPDAEAAERVAVALHPVALAQTTFAADELEKCLKVLKRRFPEIICRGGLCRASEERQRSVRELAARVELVVVIGAAHSSNARRLCETAERGGTESLLAESATELPERVFGLARVGLTSGASTPDEDFNAAAERFAASGFEIVDLKRA